MSRTAIQIDEHGGPEVLQLRELPSPEPGPGDLLINVHASGINFIDTYQRSGLYEMVLPFIPGSEGSGTIAAVGDGVTGFSVGGSVAWVGSAGSYASQVVIPTAVALDVSPSMSLSAAAALPLQGMTAHYLIDSVYPLSPGDRCLIHAAAGGTGRLLVQMAKLRGAEVVATVGSDEKAKLARSAGADHVINYQRDDIVEGVEAAVGTNAIDVVYDGVGANTFDAGLAVLRVRGTMATFGNASGPVPPVAPLALMPKSLLLTRPKLGDFTRTPEERDARWNEIVGWVESGELDIRIGREVLLAEAADAHHALESRQTTGKLLLRP
ncbi:MAG: quinone oxidoreductase [Acidimicrobiaceae bacterium]|nr:quinone oxidoreductase [Acidimicrobiaceae bacterium]MDG1410958.1 quinone oxidoreductase [Acidimicrobiales bacterium]MDG2217848.1 quinone oxidoreductase [Acidimicrobiales bacterium]